jgi:hypothetical protein
MGYRDRRIHVLLRRDGWRANIKRVRRLVVLTPVRLEGHSNSHCCFSSRFWSGSLIDNQLVVAGPFTCIHKLRRDYTSGIGSPTTSTIVVSVCTGELSGVVPLGRLDGFTDSSFTSRHRYNPLGVRHCPPRLIAILVRPLWSLRAVEQPAILGRLFLQLQATTALSGGAQLAVGLRMLVPTS